MEKKNLPVKLSYPEVLDDLNTISINNQDILFKMTTRRDRDEYVLDVIESFAKLEKLAIFKANFKTISLKTSMPINSNNKNCQFSLKNLLVELDLLEGRLNALNKFLNISSKFIDFKK
jgi:hypothetical protein